MMIYRETIPFFIQQLDTNIKTVAKNMNFTESLFNFPPQEIINWIFSFLITPFKFFWKYTTESTYFQCRQRNYFAICWETSDEMQWCDEKGEMMIKRGWKQESDQCLPFRSKCNLQCCTLVICDHVWLQKSIFDLLTQFHCSKEMGLRKSNWFFY